jgi:hypothetical protein
LYDGEKTTSSTNVAGKTGFCMQKTETRFMCLTLYKYQLSGLRTSIWLETETAAGSSRKYAET